MSRVGKKPILIPEGLEIKIEGHNITVKGPKGQLSREIRPEVKVEVKDNQVQVSIEKESNQSNAFWGLSRSLIANMVKGVVVHFEKKLEIRGVGFRATLEGEDLELFLGFTHPIKLKVPQGLNVTLEKNIITVSGSDKELVGQFSATIRKFKPPEPYKGKGIRYIDEVVRKKVGKKVVAAGSN